MTYEEFRAQLKSNGLNVNKFGALVGKEPSYISHWKHAKRGVPRWVGSWLTLWAFLPEHAQQAMIQASVQNRETAALSP